MSDAPSSNGRTPDFESGNRGSSPRGAAIRKRRQIERQRAGLTLLSRWVPLDIKPEADALIDRLIAEYDARKAVAG